MESIEYLAEILHFRLQNTRKYLEELKEVEEELEALKKRTDLTTYPLEKRDPMMY